MHIFVHVGTYKYSFNTKNKENNKNPTTKHNKQNANNNIILDKQRTQ